MKKSDYIYEYISKNTIELLNKNMEDWSKCSAYDISIEFNMRRSNVSRILNNLFDNGLLLKIKSRPTIYLSIKDTIKVLNISNLPSIIKWNSSQGFRELIKILSQGKDRSGYIHFLNEQDSPTFSKLSRLLFPILIYPANKKKIALLYGHSSDNKEILTNLLLSEGQRSSMFSKSSKPIFFTVSKLLNEFFIPNFLSNILSTFPELIILTVPKDTERIAANLIANLTDIYRNNINYLPTFLINYNYDNIPEVLHALSDITIKIPQNGHSDFELLNYIANIFEKESVRLNRTIKIKLSLIYFLLSLSKKATLKKVSSTIFRMIATSQTNNSNNSTIYIQDAPQIHTLDKSKEPFLYLNKSGVDPVYSFHPDSRVNIKNLQSSLDKSSRIYAPQTENNTLAQLENAYNIDKFVNEILKKI